MVCPYCSNDMEPIELNGKVFCSNCGLTVKTLTEPTRLNPDAKIIGGYKPERTIPVPVQPAANPFPSNTPPADPINMNPITDETREEFGFEIEENANNDLAIEEIPETTNQAEINIPVDTEYQAEEKTEQEDDISTPLKETTPDTSYNIPVETEIIGNPASDNEIDNIVKTLSEAELSSHKPLYNQNIQDQIKGIDTLAAGGILLDILSDDLTREENSAEVNALKAARRLVTKITPGNIDPEVETISNQAETDSAKFAAELAKDASDIKELESKLENIIEPVTEVYDKDIKKFDPDALNSARVKIEHRSRQGHVPTPKASEPQKIDTGETDITESKILEVPKIENESTPLFINPVKTDVGNNGQEDKIEIDKPVPNVPIQTDDVQTDEVLKPEQQLTTEKDKPKAGFLFSGQNKGKLGKLETETTHDTEPVIGIKKVESPILKDWGKDKDIVKDEIKDIEKKIKKGFFASFGKKTNPEKEIVDIAIPKTDVAEVIPEKIIEKPFVVAMKSAETVAKEASQKLAEVETAEDETKSEETEDFTLGVSNDKPTLGSTAEIADVIETPVDNLNDQVTAESKEYAIEPLVIGSSPIVLPTRKQGGFLGLFKKKTASKPDLELEKKDTEPLNGIPENINNNTEELEPKYVLTADDKKIDIMTAGKGDQNLEDDTPAETQTEKTTETTPKPKEIREKKSFWDKFKKESKPGAEEKPAEAEVAEEVPTEESPAAETEQPEEDIQTNNASNDKEDKKVVENHVTADYFKKVLEVKKAQQKLVTKKDKKAAKNKGVTAKKILKISLLTIIGGFAVLVASFLVYNNNKPEVKLERTLGKVEFTTKKPSYIPEGYKFADSNYNVDTKIFELTYQFITDKNRKIVLTETIKPEPQKYIDDLLKTDFKDQEYTIKDVDGQEFTEIKKYNLIWYRAEMVYTLHATNTNMDNQLLYKMTESIE